MSQPAIAYVIDANTHHGIRTVQIICPCCAQIHTHGWPLSDKPGSPIGHRNPHCTDQKFKTTNRAGYFIELPPAEAPDEQEAA